MLTDGTLSSRNIIDFADDVKALSNLSYIEDLNQVIPAEYLDWEGEDCVFQHYGKEYGFYMVKEGNYFDLLLIDFVYEYLDEYEKEQEQKLKCLG